MGTWDYSTLPSNVKLGTDCFIERRDRLERYRSLRDAGARADTLALDWMVVQEQAKNDDLVTDDYLLLHSSFSRKAAGPVEMLLQLS